MEITRSILRPISGTVFSTLAAGLAAVHLAIPAMVVADIPVPQEPNSGEVSEPAQARQLKPGQTPKYSGDLRSLAALNIRNARLEKVITGLDRPWALEFLSSNEVIITEMPGRLSRHNLETGAKAAIDGLPEIASDHDQSGLLDIELHPDYDNNGRIYFSYVISDGKSGRYYLTAVATAVLNGNRLEEVKQILAAGPFGWSPSNFGGALEFDAGGYLYVSIGDRSEPVHVQDGHRLQGKILRVNDDGTVPADNPFVGNEDIDERIYALGVRNAQGLHFDHQSGRLFEAEHGPLGGDEVNVILSGANYGWPVITYGKDYTTEPIGEGTHKPGLEQPLFYYLPSIAVSSLEMYRGSMFEEWDGDLLVGALKGKHISKLDLDGDVVRSSQPMLKEIKGRVRDIKVAADGSIHVLSENGTLYRLYREPAPESVERPVRSALIYDMVCSGCHDTGADSAPVLGHPDQWKEILAQPRELTYERTIEGYEAMPERGLCGICTDRHLKATVDYMLDQALIQQAKD